MNWINKHKFVVAISAQLLIVALIVAYKMIPSFGGQEVLLKIMPVDPRDWLRGDYVTYRLEISDRSNLNNYLNSGFINNNSQKKNTVFISLINNGKYWEASSYSLEKPESGVFIKGNYNGHELNFGIEEYFIPEGTGRALPSGTAFAKVQLAKDGQPLLKSLIINGKPWP